MRFLAVFLACLGIGLIPPATARSQEILAVEIDADTANLMTEFTVIISPSQPRGDVELLIKNDERTFTAIRRIASQEMSGKRTSYPLRLLAPFDAYRITLADDEPPFLVSTKRLAKKISAAKAPTLPWTRGPESHENTTENMATGRGIASFHLPRSEAARLLIVVFDDDGRIADQYFGVYPGRRSWNSRPLPIRTYHFAMAGADSSGNPVEVTPEKAFIEQTP